jgi:thioredoxin reductase
MREEPVARLLPGPRSGLQAVVLEGGEAIPRNALFLRPAMEQRSDLPGHLGCPLTPEGHVEANVMGQTKVKGVYIAGDMGRNLPQIVSAAASGATAASFLNHELLEEEFGD